MKPAEAENEDDKQFVNLHVVPSEPEIVPSADMFEHWVQWNHSQPGPSWDERMTLVVEKEALPVSVCNALDAILFL